MAKFKERQGISEVVEARDTKKQRGKCVVRVKRLGKGALNKARSLNKQSDLSVIDISNSSSVNGNVIQKTPNTARSEKIRKCVIRLKRSLHEPRNLKQSEDVLGEKQGIEDKYDHNHTVSIENISKYISSTEKLSNNPETKSQKMVASTKYFKSRKKQTLSNNASTKELKSTQKLGTGSNGGDVYEFPSQSSISEKEDPTSEVVRNLIKRGKVAVAKHLKGKGKNRIRTNKNTSGIKNNLKRARTYKKASEQDNSVPLKQSKASRIISSPPNIPTLDRVATNSRSNYRSPVTDKRKLLEFATNFVKQSTPIRKQKNVLLDSPVSPIPINSPWRPADESILPKVFYFSRNKDNLPSYASDVIPSTQVAERSRRSFLNHSDIENVNPDRQVSNTINHNPRKTLGHRSPLKSINILDITNLPKRATINKTHEVLHQSSNKSLSPINKTRLEPVPENQTSHNVDPENLSIENFFGFEDSLDNTAENETSAMVPDKSQLLTKLKNLHRLLPPEKPIRASHGKTRNIFAEESSKQRDIRDVLTSTFKENVAKSKSVSNPGFEDISDISAIPEEENQSQSRLHLFGDLDEPKPFSDSGAHLRTYIRHARKRRQEHPLSDEEEGEQVPEAHAKKRSKPVDKKSEEELNKFIEDFNSMCEEVDQYQLQVEKG